MLPVALSVVLASFTACGETGEADEAQELYGTQMTAIDDELWVYAGLAGPLGSSPPVTSIIPPGWGPNRTVSVYSPAGDVLRRMSFPKDIHRAAIGGRVLRDGGAHYLVTNLCDGSIGCAGQVNPFLLRAAAGEDLQTVPLDLPAQVFGDDVGAGFLTVVGHTDGTAWVLQDLGNGSGIAGLADRHALVAIDLTTGRGKEVALPAGLYGAQLICMAVGHLFAAQAILGDDQVLEGMRVLQRPATAEPTEWTLHAHVSFDVGFVGGGQLQCLDPLDELVLIAGFAPTHLVTMSMTTGAETTARTSLPGGGGVLLGLVDGAALLTAQDAEGRASFWRHRAAATWTEITTVESSNQQGLVVLDDRLYDATAVLTESGPDTGRLAPVALDAN